VLLILALVTLLHGTELLVLAEQTAKQPVTAKYLSNRSLSGKAQGKVFFSILSLSFQSFVV